MTDPRVLFLHGLESDPTSPVGKAADLRASFTHVCAPELHTGKTELHRRNSVARCLLRLPALRAAIMTAATSILSAVFAGLPLKLAALGVALPLAAVAACHKWLIAASVEASVAASFAVAVAALKDFRPAVVVGSSWGGGLAQLLVQQGLYDGPVLFLAPAGRRVAKAMPQRSKLTQELSAALPSSCVGVVLHGTRDSIVPMVDSKILTAQSPRCVVRTCNDIHALNKVLHREALAALVREVAALR